MNTSKGIQEMSKKIRKTINLGTIDIPYEQIPFGDQTFVIDEKSRTVTCSINLRECRDVVKDFLQTDKQDGKEHCYYIWHRQLDAISAFDTTEQLIDDLVLKIAQGFGWYKDIEVEKLKCTDLGVKRAVIHVFRNEDENLNLYGLNLETNKVIHDNVSITFGYIPAQCEDCITQVFY